MKQERALVLMIAASSLAALAYEVILIRIFSISLWYHFAFMVISVAMLGIGASGTLLSLFPKAGDIRVIPLYPLFVGLSIPATYLVANSIAFDPAQMAWDRMQFLYMALYPLVLSLPFLCSGLLISAAFVHMRRTCGIVYAADLIGAGAGALLTLWLLDGAGPEKGVFIIACLPLLPLVFFSGRYLKLIAAAALLMNAALAVAGPDFTLPRISPYKPLSLAMQFPGARHLQTYHGPHSRIDLFTSPASRFAPGLSLQYLKKLPDQTGLAVDAGDISAITDQQEPDLLAFIDYLPASLPYALSSRRDILILDPRGGLHTLIAKYYHAQNVYSVESDPLLLKAVREYSRQHAPDLNTTQVWPGLGRTWLMSSNKIFDVIDISIMGSMPHAAFGFAEDYRFTREAFQTYLNHLKPDGILSVNLFILPPPRTELRLITTIAAAAEHMRMGVFSQHVAIARSWDSLIMLIKKTPLTTDDIERIKRFCSHRKFDLVYYPGIEPGEGNRYVRTAGNEYASAIQSLFDPLRRERFMDEYVFDILPAQDDRPFFHYYLKLENLGTIYRLMGEKWHYFIEEGYLLPMLFIQVFVVSAGLILLPILVRSIRAPDRTVGKIRALAYFGCLGLGYLFIEIALIQNMILPLEHPPYAVSTVLLALLFGSGCGSLLAERFPALRNRRVVLAIALLVLLYGLSLPLFMQSVLTYSLTARIVLAFLLAMPAGLLMGIPFPLGLSLMGERNPELIPWAWAINGCCSVIAPIIATMIALSVGFSAVLIIAALLYFTAFLIFPALKKIERRIKERI